MKPNTTLGPANQMIQIFLEGPAGQARQEFKMPWYCFEAFRFLAKTYLGVESHDLCDVVQKLLNEVDMVPSDVAKKLTRKSIDMCISASLVW